MIDSIKLKTNRRFKLREQPQAAPGEGSGHYSMGLEKNFRQVVAQLGLNHSTWFPSLSLSTDRRGVSSLRLSFKCSELGVSLIGTETHLTGVNLTLPKLWSGSQDNSYILKNDEELDKIRSTVFALLDHFTDSPGSGGHRITEIHLCYQGRHDFDRIQNLYSVLSHSGIRKRTSVTEGQSIRLPGTMIDFMVYNKKIENADGSAGNTIRFEARLLDTKKIAKYFGLEPEGELLFEDLTMAQLLTAYRGIASDFNYPKAPPASPKWDMYQTLAAVRSSGWRYSDRPAQGFEDEDTGMDVVDLHTQGQSEKSKKVTNKKVSSIVDRWNAQNAIVEPSIRLIDLLPGNTTAWSERFKGLDENWANIPFVGLEELWNQWFNERLEIGAPGAPAPGASPTSTAAPSSSSPSTGELVRYKGEGYGELIERLRGGRDAFPVHWFDVCIPAVVAFGAFCASERALEVFLQLGMLVAISNPVPVAEDQGSRPSIIGPAGDVFQMTGGRDALSLVVESTPPLVFLWAESNQSSGGARIMLTINDVSIEAPNGSALWGPEWRFTPLREDPRIPQSERSNSYDRAEIVSLYMNYLREFLSSMNQG